MKVLIVGASGFLGKKLYSSLSKEFMVIGTSQKSNGNLIKMDITERKEAAELIISIRPDIVIVSAAMTDADLCEIEKERANNINVIGIKNITIACVKINAKLIFFSSDYVFDGKKGGYNEDEDTNPLNFYGKTKVESEEIVKNSGLSYIIARISWLYGFNSPGDKQTFVNFVVNNLKSGKEIRIVKDQVSNPTLIDDIADAIKALIKKKEEGLFHIAGREPISRYDFSLRIAKVFGLDTNLIKETTTPLLRQKASRPANSSLDITKLQSLGVRMSNVYEGLKKMKRQMV